MHTLRQCQKDMIEAIESHTKGVVCSFVGTGKSRVMYEVTEKNKDQTLLVFPSLGLVEQFGRIYFPEARQVTCHPKEPEPGSRVTLTTYSSLHKLEARFRDYSLVLFDESHHVCTSRVAEFLEVMDGLGTRRFFFTATPKANRAVNMFDEEGRDARLLGGIIYEYGFARALKDGVVTDYSLHFHTYANDGRSREDIQFAAITNFAKAKSKKHVLIYNQYVDEARNGRTSVSNFERINPSVVRSITGTTTPEQRAETLKWFQEPSAEIKILANVGTVKEGIDIPCVDMIAFCDDKRSKVDIVQCLGRGLRKYEGKKECTVMCCVPDDDPSSFQTVWYLLEALRDVDARIEDVLYERKSSLEVSYKLARTQTTASFLKEVRVQILGNWKRRYDDLMLFLETNWRRPRLDSEDREEARLARWVKKSGLNQDQVQLLENYERRADVLSRSTQWREDHNYVLRFFKIHGRFPVEHKRLKNWMNVQLRDMEEGKLEEEKREAIVSLKKLGLSHLR